MHIPPEHRVTPPTLDCYVEARDAFVGDAASEIAALLIDHVRESRQNYLEQTRAEEHQLRVVQAAQIKDMRIEADKLRDAGMYKGAAMMLSGGLTIASGVVTASNASSANRETPGSVPHKATETNWPSVFEGSAKGADGSGQLIAAHFDREAGLARADATEHEHLGSEAKRRLEALDEARSHLKDLQRSAFEHLKGIHETQASTDRTLTSWRG